MVVVEEEEEEEKEEHRDDERADNMVALLIKLEEKPEELLQLSPQPGDDATPLTGEGLFHR